MSHKSPFFLKSLHDEQQRTNQPKSTSPPKAATLLSTTTESKGESLAGDRDYLSPMSVTKKPSFDTSSNQKQPIDIFGELKKMKYLQEMLAEGKARREAQQQQDEVVSLVKKPLTQKPPKKPSLSSSSPPKVLEPMGLKAAVVTDYSNNLSPLQTSFSASAAASVFLKPQILAELEHHVLQELAKLNHAVSKTLSENSQRELSEKANFALLSSSPPSDEVLRKYEWRPEWTLLAHEQARSKIFGAESETQRAQRRIDVFGIDHSTNPIRPLDENPNDMYRSQRIRIFSSAAKIFADQFKTYRKLLLWILCEYDSYVSYCHEVLPQEGRALHEKQLRAEFQKAFETERSEFRKEMHQKEAELEEMKAKMTKLESVTSNARRMIRERDESLEFKDKEFGEAAEGRVALLSRIARLEKELWHQKELSEEPEKRIKALQRELFDAQDKIGYFGRTIADSEDTVHRLRARLEQAEETIRERKQNEQQMATRAQYQAWKRREVELLEINAQVSATNTKLSAQLEAAMTQMARGREAQMTPRPMWSLIDHNKSFPEAASSGQRVWLANEMIMQMAEEATRLKSQLQLLQGMYIPSQPTHFISTVGPLPLCLSEEQWLMHAPYIPKLGLDTRIPAFLKGVGKAINYRLDRDEVTAYCNLLWFEKELARSTVPWESIVSQVMAKYCPPPTATQQQQQQLQSSNESPASQATFQLQSVSAEPISSAAAHQVTASASSLHHQDVCYSLFYAMQWYQFDPYIKFTRETMLGIVDESSMAAIFETIKRLKVAFTDQALISDEAGSPAASGVFGSPSESLNSGAKSIVFGASSLDSTPQQPDGPATTNLAIDPAMANKPQWITRASANDVLLEFFPIFSNRKIKRLSDALIHAKASSKNANLINIPSLFTFDSNKKKRTPLITELILLKMEERNEVVADYVAALNRCESAYDAAKKYPNNSYKPNRVDNTAALANSTFAGGGGTTGSGAVSSTSSTQGLISPLSIARELWNCDPAIPKPHMDQLLCYYFESDIEQLSAISATLGATTAGVGNSSIVSMDTLATSANGDEPSANTRRASSMAQGEGDVNSRDGHLAFTTNPDVAVDYLALFEKILRRPAHRFSARKK